MKVAKLKKGQTEPNYNELETMVLEYRFIADEARRLEARRQELSDALKAKLPLDRTVNVGSFAVSVISFTERRFMPMKDAEKIVGSEVINQIVNTHEKTRLTVK